MMKMMMVMKMSLMMKRTCQDVVGRAARGEGEVVTEVVEEEAAR